MENPPDEAFEELQSRLAKVALPVNKKGTSCPFDPKILGHALNVDRTTCKRVVPMKVLALGLSRTGTASLRHALFELGYFDVYHGSAFCNENPRDCEMWVDAFRGKFETRRRFERYDWDQLFGHCMAVTDTPCDVFAEELIQAYPEAKVILTLRDSAELWKQSMERTVVQSAKCFASRGILDVVLGWFLPKSPYEPLFALNTKYSQLLTIPRDGVQMYEAHTKRVRQLVDKAKLLEFNVKQGWEPLCQFLDRTVPDVPFPHVNGEKEYRNTVAAFEVHMGFVAVRNLAVLACIFIGIVLAGIAA